MYNVFNTKTKTNSKSSIATGNILKDVDFDVNKTGIDCERVAIKTF